MDEVKVRGKRWRPSLTAYRELETSIKNLQSEKITLEASNGYMEKEIIRLRSSIKELEKDNESLRFELQYLQNRSFWQRIFNK